METKIFELIKQEQARQEQTINLIASENYVDNSILQAAGSVLTNKYAEGYPGKRYYGGCAVIDQVESLAIELGKQLFKAPHINVQPHSGSSANLAVYLTLLTPGDTVLSMSLAHGGHLTHGHKLNFSGKLYNIIHYGVDPQTELIDYQAVEALAHQHKPRMIIAGASAYSRLIDYAKFQAIARSVGAFLFVDMAHIAGLVAADIIPSPIPWADIVSSTTHKTLRGPRGGMIIATSELDATIDKSVMPGSQGGPLMHIIAAKALCFEQALRPAFKAYAQQVVDNAQVMAKTFTDLGHRVVSGGTDTHLFMIDLRNTKQHGTLTGKDVEALLERCSITLNRNTIPGDPQSPMITSGIRIGTPAVTTRGMGRTEVQQIAVWIDEAIRNKDDESFLQKLKQEVENLCARFQIYS